MKRKSFSKHNDNLGNWIIHIFLFWLYCVLFLYNSQNPFFLRPTFDGNWRTIINQARSKLGCAEKTRQKTFVHLSLLTFSCFVPSLSISLSLFLHSLFPSPFPSLRPFDISHTHAPSDYSFACRLSYPPLIFFFCSFNWKLRSLTCSQFFFVCSYFIKFLLSNHLAFLENNSLSLFLAPFTTALITPVGNNDASACCECWDGLPSKMQTRS